MHRILSVQVNIESTPRLSAVDGVCIDFCIPLRSSRVPRIPNVKNPSPNILPFRSPTEWNRPLGCAWRISGRKQNRRCLGSEGERRSSRFQSAGSRADISPFLYRWRIALRTPDTPVVSFRFQTVRSHIFGKGQNFRDRSRFYVASRLFRDSCGQFFLGASGSKGIHHNPNGYAEFTRRTIIPIEHKAASSKTAIQEIFVYGARQIASAEHMAAPFSTVQIGAVAVVCFEQLQFHIGSLGFLVSNTLPICMWKCFSVATPATPVASAPFSPSMPLKSSPHPTAVGGKKNFSYAGRIDSV